MSDNKLAPPGRNALADRTQRLLRETAEAGPQYGELVDYLSARRMMPPIKQQALGSVGEFEWPQASNKAIPQTGIVKLSLRANPNTLVHELTHAAQRQIELQYSGLLRKSQSDKLTEPEKQFMNAYEKLIHTRWRLFGNNPEHTQLQTAQRIAPEWAKSKSNYRSTGSELAAFGMGSAISPNTGYPAPLHIDPSYATEFSILLDLARRANVTEPGR